MSKSYECQNGGENEGGEDANWGELNNSVKLPMLTKIKDSFIWELEKRMRNPFLGAFIISWIFWNWDFIYVVFFVSEQYVSLLPKSWETTTAFITKLDYIKSHNLVNLWNYLINPLWSSIIFVFLTEWVTTFLNIIVVKVKNAILGYESLTKDEAQELKNRLVEKGKEFREWMNIKNDLILSLESKVSDLEFRIDEKVDEKVRITQWKNLIKIKNLESSIEKSELILTEKSQENIFLKKRLEDIDNQIAKAKKINSELSEKIELLKGQNNVLEVEKNDLIDRISGLDKPITESYKEEYEEFKRSYAYANFWDFIDENQENPYQHNSLTGRELKYLEVKNIVRKIPWDYPDSYYYEFTTKWDKFVEYYLDNYAWPSNRQNINKNLKDIPIEDIPF